MREVKFRAKYKQGELPVLGQRLLNEGTWVYGDLRTRKVTPCIYDDKAATYPIDINTICQFTGLHDKDGREIYEGDLVEMMRTPEKTSKSVMTRHIVTAESVRDWMFKSLTKEVLSLSMCNQSNQWDSYRYKVVGNIYDNPDMVKEVSLNLPESKPRKRNNKVTVDVVVDGVKLSTKVSQKDAQALIDRINNEK